ncbi:unnamed protein product [Cercospora beticola]|nr:unnamed protein product [Cercospora beticola]
MITYQSTQAGFGTNTGQTCNGQSTIGRLDRKFIIHSNNKLHPCLFLHGQAVMPRFSGRILKHSNFMQTNFTRKDICSHTPVLTRAFCASVQHRAKRLRKHGLRPFPRWLTQTCSPASAWFD